STADHNFNKYLTTKEPVDGYSLANIEWSDKVGETKVTIGKDGNFATITFNQALLSQTGPNTGPAFRGVTPPMPLVPMPNPGGAANAASSKLPGGVPAVLQQVLPTDAGPPYSRGLIQRDPRGSAGGASPRALFGHNGCDARKRAVVTGMPDGRREHARSWRWPS